MLVQQLLGSDANGSGSRHAASAAACDGKFAGAAAAFPPSARPPFVHRARRPRHYIAPTINISNGAALRTLRRVPGRGCHSARCTTAPGWPPASPPRRRQRLPTCGSSRRRCVGWAGSASYQRLRCCRRLTLPAREGCASSSSRAGCCGRSLRRRRGGRGGPAGAVERWREQAAALLLWELQLLQVLLLRRHGRSTQPPSTNAPQRR